MKKWTGILLALLCSGFAHAADHDGVLFEVTPSKLLPATEASLGNWDNLCFTLGRMDDVCPALQELFGQPAAEASEAPKLLACSIDEGYPLVSYSIHNIERQDQFLLYCPIFIK